MTTRPPRPQVDPATTPRAETPSIDDLPFPWRFKVGEYVFLSHDREESFKIVGGFLHKGFPHYELAHDAGFVFAAPQISVLSAPL